MFLGASHMRMASHERVRRRAAQAVFPRRSVGTSDRMAHQDRMRERLRINSQAATLKPLARVADVLYPTANPPLRPSEQ